MLPLASAICDGEDFRTRHPRNTSPHSESPLVLSPHASRLAFGHPTSLASHHRWGRSLAAACFAACATCAALATSGVLHGQSTPAAPTPPASAPAAGDEADRARIAELEAKLAEALARIAQLEAELVAAKAGAGNPASGNPAPGNPADANPAGGAGTPAPPATAPAETSDREKAEPAIQSVGQFFDLVKAEYAVAFPAPEAGQQPEAGPAFKRSIERFAISINRAWRQPIRWTVVLKKAVRGPEGTLLTVQPLRADGSALGDEIAMRVDTIRNRRLDAILQKARMNDTYVINGLFIPKIVANADRLTEGVFNNPPLVGPGIEFRYDITVDGLAVAKEPVVAEPTAPATR
jgi:hypothetical protein